MTAERVLITGTTSGVGLALLEHYARNGTQVVSVNRRRVPELEAAHPSVRFEHVDVRSAEAVAGLVRSLVNSAELPSVFILNAGINRIDNDESFELDDYKAVMETNLYGVLHFVEPLIRLPATGVPRHVIAISSMARYAGNPHGLGYTTSKKSVTACFDIWSKMYAGTDLVFQQVMLGPVHSSIYTMAEHFPAWMVWLRNAFAASPEATARAISRFALTRRRKLFYPRRAVPLFLGMGLGQSLVPGFFQGQKTLGRQARRQPP